MKQFLYLFYIAYLIGWGLSIYKAVKCNWDPIGKAEVLYTVGAVTSLGGIIGYFDIKDK